MKHQPDYRTPPRLAEWMLKHIYPDKGHFTPLGDFGEAYNTILEESNRFHAGLWYWWQVLKSIPSYAKNKLFWRLVMFKNYTKIALRNIRRYKVYSLINMTGLAIGIACCLLITLWVLDELSYDKFHEDADQIYQVLTHGTIQNNTTTPIPFAPVFKEAYPEIILASRYEAFDDALVTHGDKAFYENSIRVVDPDFFKIFSFTFKKGDPNTTLDNTSSVVISDAIAEKYFPGEDPIGKVISMNRQRDFTVTGVIENVPQNSTLHFEMAIPFEIWLQVAQERGSDPTSWGWWSPSTFIKLRENVPVDAFNGKIADFLQRHADKESVVSVLPFTERYHFFWNTRLFILIFSVIAMIILVVACINFMNLTTARSANRAREIGIRKVTGAYRKHLIMQFLGESFFMTFGALMMALLLVTLLLPSFNAVTGKTLTVKALGNQSLLPIFIGLITLTGLASGSYPALFLSSFQPVHVLKSELRVGSRGSRLRKVLVGFQFSISIFLIIGTGIVYKQLNYLKTKDIGYVKERLINVPMEGESRNFYDALRNRLLLDERIVGVSGTSDDLPYFGWSTGTARWEGKDPNEKVLVFLNYIDYDFIETLGIPMVEGRSFSREFALDDQTGLIVNEEMARIMGLESTVGANFILWGNPRTIVGVVQDFHFQSLNNQINPIILLMEPERIYNMMIRTRSGNSPAALRFIQETWEAVVPIYPFEYSYIRDDFDGSYRSIERMGNLVNSFTFIALFIACLGLFGLASFTTDQRSKEIGVRKVLGSSVSGIVLLLSKEFTKCVLLANIIAWPAAYFVSRSWLQGFAYRIGMRVDVFVLAAALALVISVLTVSFQAIKSARANPVETLRYE